MAQTSLFSRPRSAWAEVVSGGLREWRHPREIVVPRCACVSDDFSREVRQGSHMQARFYLPMYGRFASPDPARDQHFEQTQSWNIYSYVQNSPTMRIDPTGMVGVDEVKQYAKDVGKALVGEAKGVAAVGVGIAKAVAHPVNTAKAIGNAVAHPIATAKAVGSAVSSAVANANTPEQAGKLVGNALANIGLVAAPFASAAGGAGVAGEVANAVPSTLARVIPGAGPFPTLGAPGSADVFVTNPAAIEGLNAAQISQRLTIPASDSFTVIKFPTPTEGLASPVFRTNPGFIGGGRTAGGAPEFVVPNGPVPAGSTTTIVGSGQ